MSDYMQNISIFQGKITDCEVCNIYFILLEYDIQLIDDDIKRWR